MLLKIRFRKGFVLEMLTKDLQTKCNRAHWAVEVYIPVLIRGRKAGV